MTQTRNYYVHYSRGLKKKAADDWPLVLLTKRLAVVVRALMLKELGLTLELVEEALQLDYEWDWLCAQPDA